MSCDRHVMFLLWSCDQASIGVAGDVGYTCETASYFFLYQVAPLWDKYYGQIKTMADQVWTPGHVM